jgi:hypothetical protein
MGGLRGGLQRMCPSRRPGPHAPSLPWLVRNPLRRRQIAGQKPVISAQSPAPVPDQAIGEVRASGQVAGWIGTRSSLPLAGLGPDSYRASIQF